MLPLPVTVFDTPTKKVENLHIPHSNLLITNNKPLPSLKLTAKAPENGWLEYKPFLLKAKCQFSGANVLVW